MANPVIVSAMVELMKHAFQRKNLKSKTSIAAATVAAGTTAAIQAGVSPGSQAFPANPEKAVILDMLFYLVSAILFFWKGRGRQDHQ